MKKIVGLLALSLLLPLRARASITAGTQEADLNLGIADPLTSYNANNGAITNSIGSVGLGIGADYVYYVNKWIGLGGDFMYDAYGSQSLSGGQTSQPDEMTGLGIAKFQIRPDSNLRPYGLVGLGWGNLSDTVSGGTLSAVSNGFAYALGGGVDYDITKNIVAGAELRWTNLTVNNNFNGAGFHDVGDLNILAHIGYKFGGR